MNARMSVRSLRICSWRSGRSPMVRNDVAMSRAVVSPPAAKRFAAIFITSSTGGSVPSGNVANAISVMMSSRGFCRRSSM
jgi:hypothetical protein